MLCICLRLLTQSSYVCKSPTAAPSQSSLFQMISMQQPVILQMPLLNILITAEIRDKVEPPSPHTLLTLGKVTACCPFHFFISQYRKVPNTPCRPLRGNKHLFLCHLGVAKNCWYQQVYSLLPGSELSEFMIHFSIFPVKSNLSNYLFNKMMWPPYIDLESATLTKYF